MKIVAMIARYLLGLMFAVFGSNMFLHFIPMGTHASRGWPVSYGRAFLPHTTFTWWAPSWSSQAFCFW